MSAAKPYPEVEKEPRYPAIEEAVLHSWQERDTFARSVQQRPAGGRGANEYVFYDGPPFANGLPHYGHLLTGFVKDIVPRYQTMRGRRVERRFGWDCHGLPAEMEAEKELGVAGREAIEAYGIARFNEYCRRSVLRYTDAWQRYVHRQGRWVSFANDYKTMDRSYMESVLWAFQRLWQKGLVYEGYKVMPYSWAMETPVSKHEMRIDDATRPRQDPAVTVAFALDPRPGDPGPMRMLAWTTTPWTLPSNLALAVGPAIEYVLLRGPDGAVLVLAAAARAAYEKELKDHEPVGTVTGSGLVGRTYTPLFPYFRGHAGAFRVLAADFVDTAEGTGVVHMAPGFGEDDQRVCEANGIKLVCPVDSRGRFTGEVPDYAGLQVFEANKPILQRLKEAGAVVRHVTIEHNYPHCWRTREPLIYKAVPGSWFVAVTRIKERMVELNRQIRWIPGHVRDGQFGKWLENAHDWSISRSRYWGAPIPVWKSDDPRYPRVDVYGSIAELERDFGVQVPDLHRPFVDQLVRPNPDDPSGKSRMRRVPEVLDCWFESGSMPFAQVHYPFENKEWFEAHFPADFIVEYIAQTRGWFYTMMVLATALFDCPPFRNVICHGVVLDERGQKLSKSLRNYPDPEQVFATLGADALRWFLVASPILRGSDLQISKDGREIAEVVRKVLNPIWNAYGFFTLYANLDGYRAAFRADSRALLDRYVLAKCRELVEQAGTALDEYDIAGACARIEAFLDALNNWYIRRSRARFWRGGDAQDARDAYDTLYTVLTTLCRVAAPLLPMLSERVYRGLTGAESVHLETWPDASSLPEDRELVRAMDRVREACSAGLSVREAHDRRIRLPLRSLTLAGKDVERLAPYADLLRDELNVKEVRFVTDLARFGTFRLQVQARLLGPRLGEATKAVLGAARQGKWRALPAGGVEVAGHVLQAGEFDLRLEPNPGVASQALPGNDAIVVLDVEVTPELAEEGWARDLVRLVQQARKDAGLDVADRIRLRVAAPEPQRAGIAKHLEYVREQTLCVEFAFGEPGPDMVAQDTKLDGHPVRVGLTRARG
ncbi:MAG: isoleucine--tRNA ligase [Planctomycetes bacterium]|nr:isoleucine--tRNA ligase [Planctomycetota bacterium]